MIMDIKKLCKILTIVEYALFVLATIFVVVFQFAGISTFVTLSLVVYTIGFLIFASISVFRIYDMSFERIELEKIADEEKKKVEIEKFSKSRIFEIVKACLAFAFAIFTFVVLILY